MKCPSCEGSGREYDAADHSSSNCDRCDGSGVVPDPIAKSCFDRKPHIGAPYLGKTCVTEA